MGRNVRKKYICGACKRKFGTENAAWTHIAFQHTADSSQIPLEIQCCDCKHVFETTNAWDEHVAQAHQQTQPPDLHEHAEHGVSSCPIDEQVVCSTNSDNQALSKVQELSINPAVQDISGTQDPADLSNSPALDPAFSDRADLAEEKAFSVSSKSCSSRSFKLHCHLCKRKFKDDNALWTHVAFKHASKHNTFRKVKAQTYVNN